MANYGGYGYQYETSPKKLQPEYVPTKKAKKKTNVKPQNTKKPSKQQKMLLIIMTKKNLPILFLSMEKKNFLEILQEISANIELKKL